MNFVIVRETMTKRYIPRKVQHIWMIYNTDNQPGKKKIYGPTTLSRCQYVLNLLRRIFYVRTFQKNV